MQADLQLRYPGQSLSREDLVDEACIAVQDLRCWWWSTRRATRGTRAGAGPQRPLPLRQWQEVQEGHGAGALIAP